MPQSWFTDEEREAYKQEKIAALHIFYTTPYIPGTCNARDIDRAIEETRQAAIDAKRAAYGTALTNEEHRQEKFADKWGEY